MTKTCSLKGYATESLSKKRCRMQWNANEATSIRKPRPQRIFRISTKEQKTHAFAVGDLPYNVLKTLLMNKSDVYG